MKKSEVKDFFQTILFAVLLATVIHWGFLEPSFVPTGSMEKTILPGDTILISKIHYGPRTPVTPLQIPLTSEKTTFFGIKSFSTLIQLPSFRLPGFSKIKRGDIIAFNTPTEKDDPIDVRRALVKRCIGLPGDEISIVDDEIFINGEKIEDNENVEFNYFIASHRQLGPKWFEKYDIRKFKSHADGFVIFTTKKNIEAIKEDKLIKTVEKCYPDIKEPLFVNKFGAENKIYNFPKIKIPHKGMEINVSDCRTLHRYFSTIKDDLPKHKIEIINNRLIIDDQEVKTYVFRKNYYFMMGDNRYNSTDSRFFGFVPKDHISGKAICVLWSTDKNKSGFYHIRWDRWFKSL